MTTPLKSLPFGYIDNALLHYCEFYGITPVLLIHYTGYDRWALGRFSRNEAKIAFLKSLCNGVSLRRAGLPNPLTFNEMLKKELHHYSLSINELRKPLMLDSTQIRQWYENPRRHPVLNLIVLDCLYERLTLTMPSHTRRRALIKRFKQYANDYFPLKADPDYEPLRLRKIHPRTKLGRSLAALGNHLI